MDSPAGREPSQNVASGHGEATVRDGSAAADIDPDSAVVQFAVLDALLAGSYESGIAVGEVRELGDFGIGCADHLGGEVVIVDGDVIECFADGSTANMADHDMLPFVDVCRFRDRNEHPVERASLSECTAQIESLLASRNLFHAVRVDGLFTMLRVRVTPRQHHPFRPLADVAREQVVTDLRDARGTLVGFWSPAIYQGVTVAGLHLHFIAEDRSTGGHVLDVTVGSARAQVTPYARFDLRLPTDPLFLRSELNHDADAGISSVEGGASPSR